MAKHSPPYWFRFANWRFVLLLALVIPLGGCGSQASSPTSTKTPQEMFEVLIANPVPDHVKDLQGVGDTDQGYKVFLRFQITLLSLFPILKNGYEEVDCQAVLQHLELPAGYDRFTPAWSPETITLAQCYQSTNPVKNLWTQNGKHYLLVDARNFLTYFSGTGE